MLFQKFIKQIRKERLFKSAKKYPLIISIEFITLLRTN